MLAYYRASVQGLLWCRVWGPGMRHWVFLASVYGFRILALVVEYVSVWPVLG